MLESLTHTSWPARKEVTERADWEDQHTPAEGVREVEVANWLLVQQVQDLVNEGEHERQESIKLRARERRERDAVRMQVRSCVRARARACVRVV